MKHHSKPLFLHGFYTYNICNIYIYIYCFYIRTPKSEGFRIFVRSHQFRDCYHDMKNNIGLGRRAHCQHETRVLKVVHGGHQWSQHALSGRTEVSSPFSLPPRKAGRLMPPDLSGIGRFRTIFMLRQQSIQRLSEMQIEQNGRKKLHRIAGGSRGSKRGNKIKMTIYIDDHS